MERFRTQQSVQPKDPKFSPKKFVLVFMQSEISWYQSDTKYLRI